MLVKRLPCVARLVLVPCTNILPPPSQRHICRFYQLFSRWSWLPLPCRSGILYIYSCNLYPVAFISPGAAQAIIIGHRDDLAALKMVRTPLFTYLDCYLLWAIPYRAARL